MFVAQNFLKAAKIIERRTIVLYAEKKYCLTCSISLVVSLSIRKALNLKFSVKPIQIVLQNENVMLYINCRASTGVTDVHKRNYLI